MWSVLPSFDWSPHHHPIICFIYEALSAISRESSDHLFYFLHLILYLTFHPFKFRSVWESTAEDELRTCICECKSHIPSHPPLLLQNLLFCFFIIIFRLLCRCNFIADVRIKSKFRIKSDGFGQYHLGVRGPMASLSLSRRRTSDRQKGDSSLQGRRARCSRAASECTKMFRFLQSRTTVSHQT